MANHEQSSLTSDSRFKDMTGISESPFKDMANSSLVTPGEIVTQLETLKRTKEDGSVTDSIKWRNQAPAISDEYFKK